MAVMMHLAVFCVITLTISCSGEKRTRSFQVDYENDIFLMDGKPFRYISGSVHYFRMPHQYWRDRLRKIKLLGLNAITTYIEWSFHEPRKGEYNFEGDADFERFIEIAEEEGLYVIARVGPYICAEREFGGFPAWLLKENPQMVFRTSDSTYKFFVDKWFQELFKRLKPLLYGEGGPVIMVQVENEYGSYPTIDKKYLTWLRDEIQNYVGNNAVLFTTDQWGKNSVEGGKIPGVFSTVDFGTTDSSMATMFENLRAIQPHGPLVNSEFYPGWLSYWGEPMKTVDTQRVIETMTELINANASFNFYMVYGGTNFGFTAGSGNSSIQKISLTSYDYDAPISEAGDLTDKYMAIRKRLREFGFSFGTDEEVERLRYSPKGDYGSVQLIPKISLLSSPIGIASNRTAYPQTMESLGQQYGFISYTHILKEPPKDASVLQVDIRDRALVLLDNDLIDILTYTISNKIALPANIKSGTKLTILVENEGRRNYELLSDVTRGIVGNATLNDAILEDWDAVSFELTSDDIRKIEKLPPQASVLKFSGLAETREKPGNVSSPVFFTGKFTLPPVAEPHHQPRASQTLSADLPLDTFLDMRGWGKGVVWVNGHNLGRYWHVGSQQTLYVPGVWLKPHPEVNKITVLELHYTNFNRTLRFVSKPIFEYIPPSAVQIQ